MENMQCCNDDSLQNGDTELQLGSVEFIHKEWQHLPLNTETFPILLFCKINYI